MKRTSTKPSTHSKKFFKEKYKEYREGFNDLLDRGVPMFDQIELNFETFEANWKAMQYMKKDRYSSDMVRAIINTQRYGIQYKTARAMKKALSERLGIEMKLRDIMQMSHRTFLDSYGEDISRDWNAMMEHGSTMKQASEDISEIWFGSQPKHK